MSLSADCRHRIEDSGLAQQVRENLGLEPFPESGKLATCERGCVLLDEDNLCSLHRLAGAQAKPEVCQTFPFVFTPTPEGVRVSVSFCCTAAQQNSGRPLQQHAEEIQHLAERTASETVVLSPGRALSHPTVERLHRFLEESVQQGQFRSALAQAWQACKALAEGSSDVDSLEAALAQAPAQLNQAALEYLDLVSISYLATFEANSEEQAQAISQALLAGGELHLERWGLRLNAEQLFAFVGGQQTLWQEGLQRYLKALLFRRVLLQKDTVVNGLMALSLVEPLFGFYLAVSLLRRQSANPQPEDYALAYDEIERELMLHCRPSMESFLERWAANFQLRLQ